MCNDVMMMVGMNHRQSRSHHEHIVHLGLFIGSGDNNKIIINSIKLLPASSNILTF